MQARPTKWFSTSSRRERPRGVSGRLGLTGAVALVAALSAGCSGAPTTSAAADGDGAATALVPTAVPGAVASSSPGRLVISGLEIACGPLTETDCRALVASLGSIADGASTAEVGASPCRVEPCPSGAAGAINAMVVLRWGEGDLKKILTCARAAAAGDVICSRAPVDLG
jgi:hypothetical protein